MSKSKIENQSQKEWRVPEAAPVVKERLYGVAIVDPPWQLYQRGKSSRSAARHYDLMTLDEIKSMPIPSLMLPDSFIHLWVTNAVLLSGQAKEVLDAWGYTPVSILCWLKETGGRLALGNFYRNNTEHVIVAKRGNPKVNFHGQPTYLIAPAQEHSHKPEEYHEIARRFSDGPYLEIFARRPYPGWDVWGNEVPSDIRIAGYEVPVYKEKAKQIGKEAHK